MGFGCLIQKILRLRLIDTKSGNGNSFHLISLILSLRYFRRTFILDVLGMEPCVGASDVHGPSPRAFRKEEDRFVWAMYVSGCGIAKKKKRTIRIDRPTTASSQSGRRKDFAGGRQT